MTCPIGGLFQKLGYNQNYKNILFLCICIWVRLGLAYVSYKLKYNSIFPYIVFIGSLICIMNILYQMSQNCVWWYREFHLVILGVILINVLLNNVQDTYKLLVLDVIGGIIMFLSL